MNNKSNIPLHFSKKLLTIEAVRNFELTGIKTDWYGHTPRVKAEFALAMDESSFWFRTVVGYRETTPHFIEHPKETFAEELWKRDVAELFLLDKESGYYQEFNFSPSGAWWSQVFSSYREPALDSYREFTPFLFSELRNGEWESIASFAKTDLSINASHASALCGNVAFIIGNPEQEFISWYTLPEREPDYHLVEEYASLSELKS